MSVKEIEKAIAQLPRHEITELSQWFEGFQNQVWDEKIERDANAGVSISLLNKPKRNMQLASASHCETFYHA